MKMGTWFAASTGRVPCNARVGLRGSVAPRLRGSPAPRLPGSAAPRLLRGSAPLPEEGGGMSCVARGGALSEVIK